MKLRNFQYRVKNLTTIDVLWDVSIRVVPYLLWCTFGAYNVIIITYIGVGFALLFRLKGNAKAPLRGTTAVEFHVFFVPYSELIGIIDFGRIRWMIAIRIHIVSVCLNMSVSLLAGCLHLAMW